ncbi:MAG: indolepyruvate ferredoxin oxidoreductase subunit alpha [Clostridia bacterium]|nr:indolepyruvate ferredoxin oxidoreductase subunit alpha [Clostridia bacterium]
MKKLMLGNEAVARGAYEAGVKVVASYPGTPSTEISEFAAKYPEIYAEWAPNEKVALEVSTGASVAGARSMSCMKHVGLNVAADPLFTASYTGVSGGLVICVADDPGMHSSQNEQDSRHYAAASKIPMLEPSDSSECRDYTKLAYELSEKYDTPVLLRLTTRISHSQSLVELFERDERELIPYKKDAMKYVMMPGMAKRRHIVVEERCAALTDYADESGINKIEYGDKKIGIITAGDCYQYAKEACPDASFLKLGMVYPLPQKLIKEFAAKVDRLVVIEELDPIIENHVKALGINCDGKNILTLLGEYSADLVKERVFGKKITDIKTADEAVPPRPPVLCPGCPHRGMHYVLKKIGLRVTGDIGCYTLGALAPLESIDTCLCMGGSVSMAHGMEKATGKSDKTVAIIGDSTFMHSGITGLIDIVYNKGTSTVIILDNSITGMTGHQDNPTTGKTLKGEATKQVDLELLCKACGIDRVTVCDPFDVDKFEKVVREEVAQSEPSVIIAQRPCALLKSVKFEGKMYVNPDKCKKCRMCMKIGCPAISFKDGVVIDETLCNGCGLCQNICKFGALSKEVE